MLPKFGGFEAQSKKRKIEARGVFSVNGPQDGVKFAHRRRVVGGTLE
jgi:hypothetical protein